MSRYKRWSIEKLEEELRETEAKLSIYYKIMNKLEELKRESSDEERQYIEQFMKILENQVKMLEEKKKAIEEALTKKKQTLK